MMLEFKGGEYVVDQMTGLEGRINGVVLWDTGNIQYQVQPLGDDEVKTAWYCDADFLVKLDNRETVKVKYPLSLDEWKYENGDKVQSINTDFKGTITGLILYSTGCAHYAVTQKERKKDGNAVNVSLPQNDIKLISKPKVEDKKEVSPRGGPMRQAF